MGAHDARRAGSGRERLRFLAIVSGGCAEVDTQANGQRRA